MKAYKIFRITSDGLRSINKSPELAVFYERGEKYTGIDGTPVFVFVTLEDAKNFLEEYVEWRKGDFEIWEVETDNTVIKLSYVPICGSNFTLEKAKTFWDQYFGMKPYNLSFEFSSANHAYICDWIIPTKRVEKWNQ